VKAKRWQDINQKDLEGFISVLFVSAIQKRKDKPLNWFSENRLLENAMIKNHEQSQVLHNALVSSLLFHGQCTGWQRL
jgi:hypothetical protein